MSATLTPLEKSWVDCGARQVFPFGKECTSVIQFCVTPLSDSITKDRRRIRGPASGGCMLILLAGKF